jgi:hypothetical protein
LFDREMVGAPLLAELAVEVYGELDATAILHHEEPLRVRKRPEGYVLSIRLPFIERANLDVFRKADELFVRIGSYKRNVILPQVLQRLEIQEASFVEDRWRVRSNVGRPPGRLRGGGREASGLSGEGSGQRQCPRTPRPGPACPVPLCPICTAATVLGQFRPEVVEHITNATREALPRSGP